MSVPVEVGGALSDVAVDVPIRPAREDCRVSSAPTAPVSVIIRTFNSAGTVRDAVDSIRRQSVPAEIVVVDSGSTDGTIQIVRETADRLIRVPSTDFSFGGALNAGATVAGSDVLVALSSHCTLPRSDWLAIAVDHLRRGALAACGQTVGPTGSVLDEPLHCSHETLLAHPYWGFSNHASAFSAPAWRRERFDETLAAGEDREWSWRVTAPGGQIVIDPALTVSGGHRRSAGVRPYFRRLVKEATALGSLRPLAAYGARDALHDWLTFAPTTPMVSAASRARGRTRAVEVLARWRAARLNPTPASSSRGPAVQSRGSHAFCYVVLSHRLPDQVTRLVDRIRELSPGAAVLVRHDRGPGFVPQLEGSPDPHVDVLVESEPIVWGAWSMVEATERAFARARQRFDPDWTVLVSGQDWPVRDLAAWERELTVAGCDAVVNGAVVEIDRSTGRRNTERDLFLARWTHRWWTLPRVPALSRVPRSVRARVAGRYSGSVQFHLRTVILRQLPRELGWKVGVQRRRGLPDGWRLRKGEQWLAASRHALAELDRVVAADGRGRAFFATSHIPDESWFQTALTSIPGLRVADGRISWHRFDRPGAPSAAVLTLADVPVATASGSPFARKVEEPVAPGVAAAIDAVVDRLRAAASAGPERP